MPVGASVYFLGLAAQVGLGDLHWRERKWRSKEGRCV